jgi:hypothetical protein
LFYRIRVLILLLVLLGIALGNWLADIRVGSWNRTVNVAIYPIAAEPAPEVGNFVRNLEEEDFAEIEAWFARETASYGIEMKSKPVKIWLGREIGEKPPAMPRNPGMLDSIVFSLKLRWWASRHGEIDAPFKLTPDVRLFVLFHEAIPGLRLPHSVGIRKGKLGIVHVFAHRGQTSQNNVIIAHELLHTFGASDKYAPGTLQPLYPIGYADPEKVPVLPQVEAEIMGGRIPISERESEIPVSLRGTRIGWATALEIGLAEKR